MTLTNNHPPHAERTTAKTCPYCDAPLAGAGPNGGDRSLAVHIRESCSADLTETPS